MAQDQLGVAERHTKPLQQRCRGVAQVVQADARQAGFLPDAVEGPRQVVRLDGLAATGREHQVIGGRRGRQPSGVLTQDPLGQRQERQVALAGLGLNRHLAELTVEALDLLANMEDGVVAIDVTPAQAHHFAAAQPVKQQQYEGRVQRIADGGLQELPGLGRRPGAHLLGMPGRQPDQAGRVAQDEFFALGLGEGGA